MSCVHSTHPASFYTPAPLRLTTNYISAHVFSQQHTPNFICMKNSLSSIREHFLQIERKPKM